MDNKNKSIMEEEAYITKTETIPEATAWQCHHPQRLPQGRSRDFEQASSFQ